MIMCRRALKRATVKASAQANMWWDNEVSLLEAYIVAVTTTVTIIKYNAIVIS